MTIKIKLDITNETQSDIFKNKDFLDIISTKGIIFTDVDYDILLIHATKLTTDILKKEKNIIILERSDSTVIRKKHELKLKNVIGILKNSILTPEHLNNDYIFQCRYHSNLILQNIQSGKEKTRLLKFKPEEIFEVEKLEDKQYKESDYYSKIVKDLQLKTEDLKKVKVGFSFIFYNKLQKLKEIEVDFNKKRSIDVQFAGNINYGNCTSATYHRVQCLKKIKELKNCKMNYLDKRGFDTKTYYNILLDSKIVVSPWGFGEVCYRDFESMYCGCVLVKPDTSFVKTYPDIFKDNKNYIPCKVDFSDLQHKIDYIKHKWDLFYDMRVKNRDMLLNAINMNNFCDYFYSIVNEFFENRNK